MAFNVSFDIWLDTVFLLLRKTDKPHKSVLTPEHTCIVSGSEDSSVASTEDPEVSKW
jgi:hypothetical protein